MSDSDECPTPLVSDRPFHGMEDRACGQARSGVVQGNATVMGEMPERSGTGAHARRAGGLERGVMKYTCNPSLSEILGVVLTFMIRNLIF